MRQTVIFLILYYILLTVGAYFFAGLLIFKDIKSTRHTQDAITLTTADGAQIAAVYLPNPKADYTFLVSHGNGDDLETFAWYLKALHQHGYAVFAYDYRGYGVNAGHPTEKGVYADITAAYDYLTTQLHIPPGHIIAYGHSLGAAVTVDLATRKPLAGIILESPFLSAYRVITQIPAFLFDPFNNLKKIRQIHDPLLIIHGTLDAIVPFWQGRKLFEQANPPKAFLAVPNAGHIDMAGIAKEKYWQALHDFVQGLKNIDESGR